MKTKGTLIALALVIFTSFNLFAGALTTENQNDQDSSKQRINIRVNQNNQVVLRAACCENHKRIGLIVKVYNQLGELVYASSISQKGGIYKAFDMQKLPEGKYTFEVHKNFKKLYSKEVEKSGTDEMADLSNNTFTVKEL